MMPYNTIDSSIKKTSYNHVDAEGNLICGAIDANNSKSFSESKIQRFNEMNEMQRHKKFLKMANDSYGFKSDNKQQKAG